MNTTTKIISTTAAVAVSAAVFFGIYSSPEQSVSDPSGIDWEQILPNINSYLPEIPGASIPNVVVQNPMSGVLPQISVPSTVSIDIPVAEQETAAIPKIEDKTPEIVVAEPIYIPKYEAEQIVMTIPKAEYDFDGNIKPAIELTLKLQKYFKDQRSIAHDKTVLSNPNVTKWISIYREFGNREFKIVPASGFRMISEIKMPKNMEQFKILKENLTYYKSRGYDSALIVFDGSESPGDLSNLTKFIRYSGFRSYFAFGGDERLEESLFVDPDRLKEQIAALSTYSSGFLLGWRRTSAHLLEQDSAFMNFLTECARTANQEIEVIGEVYYGNTASFPNENEWGFGINLPQYASSAAIVNFGFSGVNVDAVVKKLIPSQIGKKKLVGVAIGERPYYLTVHPNFRSQEENQEIKEKIERKFIDAGCVGTITLHDDGRNGIGHYVINNNLSETPFSQLKSATQNKGGKK